MEALKKAERAKQGQADLESENSDQPADRVETPKPVESKESSLSLLPHDEAPGHVDLDGRVEPAATVVQTEPVSLPDLQPLVKPAILVPELILAEPATPKAAPFSPPPQPEPVIKPEIQLQPAVSAPPVETVSKAPPPDAKKVAAAQQKARAVFTAKQPARNRTLLLASGAAVIALGMVAFGYYYWQTSSSSSSLIPANAPQPIIAANPAGPVDPAMPQQPNTPANPITAASPTVQPALTEQTRSPAVAASSDAPLPVARNKPEPAKEYPAIRIQQSAATSQLNPSLSRAYQSFLSGDTGTARQLYFKVLQQEPNNRDALLGMAAIALKNKQAGQAAVYYGKLIELDPADPEAQAGLIGLQGQSDPEQSESRLKKVLLQTPQADAANFALGNLYMQQSRWAEAQQAYFRAYSSAPGNADYAFNLAVSLDHLSQGKLALEYYQRAIAQPGPANFDKASVQTRIKELSQPVSN